MIRTRVGYAGGRSESPDYHHIGDHTETVQVDYDPNRITYRRLLDIFWESHQPTQQSWSRQYKKAVFYNNEQQREIALASKAEIEQKIGGTVKTLVAPLRSFTLAEDYHQKYILKHNRLEKELSKYYPRRQEYVNSTAAARLNGYAGGYGNRDQLQREIDSLGLSPEGEKIITESVP